MSRPLDKANLSEAAKHYAAEFIRPDVTHPELASRFISGKSYSMANVFAFDYKDEFDFITNEMKGWMGIKAVAEFETLLKGLPPREDSVFVKLLADKLAIDPNGNHIPGKIGSVCIDSRLVGIKTIEVEAQDSIQRRKALGLPKTPEHRRLIQRVVKDVWPIYAGEIEERLAGSSLPSKLPDGVQGMPVGALNTRISNVIALLMCDACVDKLDEGTVGAVIEGRVGTQPLDPDTLVSGLLLFALNAATAVTFGSAVDANPGGIATANTINPDTSANAGGTLGYCRASSANVVDTPLDDHIDGEAGTSGADFNYNTLAIVAGAQVDLTSWTVTQPES